MEFVVPFIAGVAGGLVGSLVHWRWGRKGTLVASVFAIAGIICSVLL